MLFSRKKIFFLIQSFADGIKSHFPLLITIEPEVGEIELLSWESWKAGFLWVCVNCGSPSHLDIFKLPVVGHLL